MTVSLDVTGAEDNGAFDNGAFQPLVGYNCALNLNINLFGYEVATHTGDHRPRETTM